MNYTQLSAAIQDYTQNYETDFVANIPTFVEQAEQRIYKVTNGELLWTFHMLPEPGGAGSETWSEVERGVLNGNKLDNVQVIFRMEPKLRNGYHFGSRLVFDRDGMLYISGQRNGYLATKHEFANYRLVAEGQVQFDQRAIELKYRDELNALLEHAQNGIRQLIAAQRAALAA